LKKWGQTIFDDVVPKLGTVVCVHPLVLYIKYEKDSTMSSKVIAILNFEKMADFPEFIQMSSQGW